MCIRDSSPVALLLPFSVFFAIRDAVSAAGGHRVDPPLSAPATSEAILRRGDFAFCGLIGSKTKRATFSRRLAERGVPAAAIERLTCPIGAVGIAGRAPEVIAVAAVAELLRVASAAAMPLASSDDVGSRLTAR